MVGFDFRLNVGGNCRQPKKFIKPSLSSNLGWMIAHNAPLNDC
jgi:hypothetical protein